MASGGSPCFPLIKDAGKEFLLNTRIRVVLGPHFFSNSSDFLTGANATSNSWLDLLKGIAIWNWTLGETSSAFQRFYMLKLLDSCFLNSPVKSSSPLLPILHTVWMNNNARNEWVTDQIYLSQGVSCMGLRSGKRPHMLTFHSSHPRRWGCLLCALCPAHLRCVPKHLMLWVLNKRIIHSV